MLQPLLVEERVRASLDRLRLVRVAEVLDRECQEATEEDRSYLEFLDELL